MGDALQYFKPSATQKAALISLLGNPRCRDTVVLGNPKTGVTTVGAAWLATLLTGERIDAIGLTHAPGPLNILAVAENWKRSEVFYPALFGGDKPLIDDHLVEAFQWEYKPHNQIREALFYNGSRLYVRPDMAHERTEWMATNWPVDYVWIDGPLTKTSRYERLAKLAAKNKVLWTIDSHDVPSDLMRRCLLEKNGRLFLMKKDH